MGVLDKLMFWRKKTVDIETDIEGCFTLPPADAAETADAAGTVEASDALSDESGR